MRARTGCDSGAVAVIVAILLVVILLFAAMVVDLGYWYDVRRQLQAAADAGALAGCEELRLSGSADTAWAAATQYALANGVRPADDLEVVPRGGVNPSTGHAYSEVGADFVKITVRKRVPVFFGMFAGSSGGFIHAQSRAQLQWVYGLKGIVPWSVPILAAPSRISVSIDGQAEQDLTKGSDGVWREWDIPVNRGPRTSGYPVKVTAYNSRGIPLELGDAARIVVRPADCPITDVSLDRYFAVPGSGGIDLVFSSTQPPLEVQVGAATYKTGFVNVGGNVWRLPIAVPATDDLVLTTPVSITVGADKKTSYTLSAAASLVSRRSTYPIASVSLSDYVVSDAAATVDVAVALNEYQYERVYELKVTGGQGDIGDFMAINLAEIFHPPDLSTPEYAVAGGSGGATYRRYIAEPFPYGIHVGDIVWTEAGNMNGPTKQGLMTRIGSDGRKYADWVAAGRPRGWPRLVYLPVVELYDNDKTSGHRPLIVVSFASFYIESDANEDVVRGVFLKYVTGGDILDEEAPPTFGVQAPRLVPTEVDF